ncbi:MAG: phosphate ABC transporter substrate-binding protein [Subdoligranulum sp.]|nr:phosphate ABC transporter substrate-binding protein [Subdoligranulum sp.]
MKKLISAALAASFACVAFAGCGSSAASSSAAPASAAPAATELSGKVTTGGSTSMEKVIGALQEAFMEQNSGVDVTYDPTGSGAGITGAQEGSLDIGLSSRALKDGETGVSATVIALDGIGIIVNNANTVEDLTTDQIAAIATGEVTNWKEVGGPDAEIVMIGREAGSGTRDGFESILKVSDQCKYAQELTATGAVIAAVQANENAIGYASLAALDDSVKALKVNGIACTEETVKDGSYTVQRPFVFVTKDGAQQTPAVKAFIDFAASADAASLISNAGAVPVA